MPIKTQRSAMLRTIAALVGPVFVEVCSGMRLPSASTPSIQASSSAPSSGIRVLQYGDAKSIGKYRKWIDTVRKFARDYGHDYVLQDYGDLPEGQAQALGSKQPHIILEAMQKMEAEHAADSWLLYLDLDIAVIENERLSKLPLMFSRSQQQARTSSFTSFIGGLNGRCDFVAQDSHHTVNSGFLVFKDPAVPTSRSRKLVELWKAETDRIGPAWVGDQGPLQLALLKTAIQFMSPQLAQEHAAKPDGNFCVDKTEDAHNRNLCWNEEMSKLGLKQDRRTFGSYCLLSREQRWNMHDYDDGAFEFGDTFYHGKDAEFLRAVRHRKAKRSHPRKQ